MARRAGTRKKGLFAGFLTGTALCLSLGAAATYVNPVSPVSGAASDVAAVVPEVETTASSPKAPPAETTQSTIITPRSDTNRDFAETPGTEAPEEDRDEATVSAQDADAAAPVQTGTTDISAPKADETSPEQTASVDEPNPAQPEVVPLKTSEEVPESSTGLSTTTPGAVTAPSEETVTARIDQPATDQNPEGEAMKSPRFIVDEPDNATDLPSTTVTENPSRPEVASPQAPRAAAATAPVQAVVPKAKPVIALSRPAGSTPQPAATQTVAPKVIEATPSEVPDLPKEEAAATNSSGPSAPELTLTAPKADEVAVQTPGQNESAQVRSNAPSQVVAPTIDSDPERPNIDIAGFAPQPAAPVEDAPAPDEKAPAVEDEAPVPSDAEPSEEAEDVSVSTEAADASPASRNPPAPQFSGPAFEAFAVDFIPPNNKPFLTIVLEHVGENSVAMYDLLNFGQPITFGVDTTEDLAPWRENEFRKAGFEVVALVPESETGGLSSATDVGDVPLRVADYLTAVPGAVAVLDTEESSFYRDPRKVSRLAEELNVSGRGLLFHEKFGVNRALEAARSSGTPSASLVRIIDAERDAASIRRALDRAALDASKTGAAIVFGRTYPETVAVILPWLLGNSARSVTLAPLTSTMKRIVE